MAISRTVAGLEERGLIKRNIDKNNRRRKPIKLTREGKKLVEKMLPTTRLVAKYLFDSLRLDEVLSFDYCLRVLNDKVSMIDEDGELIFVKQTQYSSD